MRHADIALDLEPAPLAGRPMGITLGWFRFFLTEDPQWDWTTITPAS